MRADGRIPVLVGSVETVAEGVRQFELVHADGQALPGFSPGSHVDVFLPDGTVRQYSLCDAPQPAPRAYTLAVKLSEASRGGSRAMHGLQRGQALAIGSPRNLFALHDGPEHAVLIAAGIGITPLLSMSRHLRAAGRSFELHQFARSEAHLLRADGGDGGTTSCGLDRDATVERLGRIVRHARSGSRLYVCGPQGFMDALTAISARWRPELPVALERFEAAPQPSDAQRAFTVRLQRTGIEVPVPPGVTILQALESRGVHPPSACESGMCGTCVTAVLEGVPEHRDEYLSAEEKASRASVCICVSRSATPLLVLDL